MLDIGKILTFDCIRGFNYFTFNLIDGLLANQHVWIMGACHLDI